MKTCDICRSFFAVSPEKAKRLARIAELKKAMPEFTFCVLCEDCKAQFQAHRSRDQYENHV